MWGVSRGALCREPRRKFRELSLNFSNGPVKNNAFNI